MNGFLTMAVLGGVMLVLAVARARRLRGGAAATDDLNRTQTLLGLTAAFAIRTTALLLLGRNGQELMTMDEPIRWNIGYSWARHPYFFTQWDGVWLPGQLAISGMLGKWIHPPLISIEVGVLLCQVITLAAMFYLGLVLTGRRWVGMAATLLAAVGYPLLWMGQGPLVETVIGGTFLLALACLARFAQVRAERGGGGWCSLVLAALMIVATNALHYIGWMAVFVGACFLVPLGLGHRRGVGRAFWPAAALISLSAAIVPALWVWYSWRVLGDPLQFVKNTHAQIAAGGAYHFGANASSLPFMAMLYPKEIAMQAGVLLPLIVAGLVMGGEGAARRRWLFGFIVALGAVMEVVAIHSGVAQVIFRSLIIVYLLLIVLACMSAVPLLGALRGAAGGGARRLAWVGLALLPVGWMGFNGLMANRYEHWAEDMPHDMIAMGKWLQQETRRPQELRGFGPKTRIGMHSDYYNDQWKDYMAYAGGCPDQLRSIPHRDFVEGRLEGYDFVFAYGSDKPVPGGELFNRYGGWRLYRMNPGARALPER